MPQAIPLAVAAISSAYTATVSALATVGVAALGEGAAIALATATVNAGITAGLSAAATALLAPKVGPVAGNPTDWVADPDAPIPFAFGRVGVAGNIVHRDTFGPDLMYQGFVTVLSGAGPINSFVGFTGDDQAVTFDGAGKAVTSQWANEMWMRTSTGAQPASALVSPSGLKTSATLPGWGSTSKLSGKAAYLMVLGENSKRTAYPTGEPKPLWVIEGLKVWDPREDSTYPGGSGDCRLTDPDTWVYSTNPALCALKWTLGLWEGPTGQGAPGVDYQVGGIGARIEGVDVPAFVEAANIADANGWIVAAYPTTDDDKAQVLDGFLQACGCIYASKAGKISCVQRAAPRASIVTISAADTAGPLEIDTAASRINRINTLRPRFWSEANRWQMTAIDEVTAEDYQTEDGGKRTRGVDFPFVPDAVQCGQLAALQIANTREGITGVIPLKPHLQRITPGDAFTITEPGFVLNGLKCLCLSTEYDPATGVHRVTFVSETDAKYPFALGQSPVPPESPTLTPGDPTLVNPPLPGDWTITPRPPTVGGQIPGFNLLGLVNNASAYRVLVEYGPTNTGPWTQAWDGPPTAESIEIQVDPGVEYWIAISYFNRAGNRSSRTIYGPFTAGPLVSGDTNSLGGRRAADLLAFFREVAGTQAETDRAAEAVIESALDDVGRVNREAGRRQAAIAAVTEVVEVVVTDLSAEITTRTSQVAALNTSVAAAQTSITNVATDLAAEVTARQALAASTTSGLASVNTSLSALSSQQTVQAGLITTAQTTANGASSSATFAISALNGNQAYLAFIADVSGRITGQRINGATGVVDFLADYFNITAPSGNGLSYSAASGRLKLVNGTRKVVLGTGSLVLWAGPTSVGDGAETVDNGTLGISGDDAYFGGRTASGPFGSGSPSGTVTLTTTFQNIAQGEFTLRAGSKLYSTIIGELYIDATPDGEGSRNGEVEIQLISVAGDYSAQETVLAFPAGGPGFASPSYQALGTNLVSLDAFFTATQGGRRRFFVQARIKPGSATTEAYIRSVQAKGFIGF